MFFLFGHSLIHQDICCAREEGLIEDISVEARIRNLVALTGFQNLSSLEDIAAYTGAMYESEQFPGAILKTETTNATYLIFQSGKVVISGTRSTEELELAVKELIQILSQCAHMSS